MSLFPSIFAFLEFLFQLTWSLFRPEAALVCNFMKYDAIFKKYLTAEHAESAEII